MTVKIDLHAIPNALPPFPFKRKSNFASGVVLLSVWAPAQARDPSSRIADIAVSRETI